VLRLLVGSLCPAIYGHELVKAGLILGLFGGTAKFVGDQVKSSQSHTCLGKWSSICHCFSRIVFL
jgi:DNA helicase MCM8